MAELISSKTVVQEESPRLRNIPGVPTAIAAMVGVTEKGPVLTPTLVTSFDEWVDIYGGYISDSKFAAMVEHAFNNGLKQLHTSRVVHYNSILNAATKTSAEGTVTLSTPAVAATAGTLLSTRSEKFLFVPTDTLVIKVDGGGALTATFNATAGLRTSGNVQPFALANNDTLTLKVDGGAVQTVTFVTADFASIAAATAAEVAFVINRDTYGLTATVSAGAVVLTSDRQGTSSSIEVTGGTANTVGKLNFPTPVSSGTGNVAFIDAVTAAEIETVVEAAVAGLTVTPFNGRVRITSNTTGTASSIEVTAASTASTKVGLDNLVHSGTAAGTYTTLRVDGKYDGAYANDLRAEVSDATSGVVEEFNFTIRRNGVAIEVFPNASMDDNAANYIETLVNAAGGSTHVEVADLDAATTAGLQRPRNGSFAMAGGSDGLVGLDDTDYVGSQAGGTGFYAFDQIQGIRNIAAPDRATAAVQNALIDYASITRGNSMFAAVTTPSGLSATGVITFVQDQANLIGKAEVSAVYWPHLKVLNPSPDAFGDTDTIILPPTASILGLYGRIDGARDGGVYDEPAGLERGILVGVQGLETDEPNDERKRDLVAAKFINPIHTQPGAPFFVDDCLVLKRDGNFPTVAQRRGVIKIEQEIKDGLESFRHRANDEETRAEVENSILAYLLVQFKNRAFRGKTPTESYFVDLTGNTAVVINAEKLVVRIGVATQRPARFLILRFSQDLRDVEAELASA
jgi:hypothetical protein